MFHVKQPRKGAVKLDPGSGDGKYGAGEPEPSGELTVRVRIRGRDQGSDQGEQPSAPSNDVDARIIADERVDDEEPGTVDESSPDRTAVDEIPEETVKVPSVPEVSPPGPPTNHAVGVMDEESLVERGPYVPRPIPRILAVANQKGGV